LDILETTTNHTKSVCVRSEPMLTFIGQTCRQGLFFQGCECGKLLFNNMHMPKLIVIL
jgi:hypothetical protein